MSTIEHQFLASPHKHDLELNFLESTSFEVYVNLVLTHFQKQSYLNELIQLSRPKTLDKHIPNACDQQKNSKPAND